MAQKKSSTGVASHRGADRNTSAVSDDFYHTQGKPDNNDAAAKLQAAATSLGFTQHEDGSATTQCPCGLYAVLFVSDGRVRIAGSCAGVKDLQWWLDQWGSQ